jgi:para-nitrobenzyl esterase
MDRRDVLSGLAATAAAVSLPPAGRAAPHDAVVETTAGKVRGLRVDGAYAFTCVPYGASTAGEGRFMPPRPVAPWAGVRDVPAQRVIAPQVDPTAPPPVPGSPSAAVSGIGSEAGSLESEDCLNVTIYTPGLDSARRPVMFWCHGGGFFAGSGSAPMYDGVRLAALGGVVVVNVTHRLNVLGYLHLPESGAEFAASGNVGMQDIALALKWTRDNIERFGGDPKRVLIFGQSGGGAKVSILTAMPSARGLFQRAAIQSGALRRLTDAQAAAETGSAFAATLGFKPTQARELQRVPLERLMAANFAFGRQKLPPGVSATFSPLLDGTVVPAQPFDPAANPLNADVPLIVGGARTEQTAFSLRDAALFRLDDAGLKSRLAAQFGERIASAAIALYRRERPEASPSDLYFEIVADRGRSQAITIASMKTQQHLQQRGAPAWLYEVVWNTPVFDGMLRTPHSIDLPLIFNLAASERWKPFTGGGSDAVRVARAMSEAWVAFAQTGRPDTVTLAWPKYSLDRRDTMLFDVQSAARPDPFHATRVFWDEALASML